MLTEFHFFKLTFIHENVLLSKFFITFCNYNNARVTGVFNIWGVTDRLLEVRKNSFSQKVVTRQPEGVGAVMGFKVGYEGVGEHL